MAAEPLTIIVSGSRKFFCSETLVLGLEDVHDVSDVGVVIDQKDDFRVRHFELIIKNI